MHRSPRTTAGALRSACFGAGLAALAFTARPWFEPAAAQEDPPAPVVGVPSPLSENERVRGELEAGLIGTWNLKRFVHPDRTGQETDVIGAALFAPDAMSIVFHARSQPTFEPEPFFFVQAGLHYWRVDEALRLQTSTIIAHSDMPGPMVYESAFQPREFNLLLDADKLSLTRPDGARLEFERVAETAFPEAALERIREARAGRARSR